MQHPHLTKNSYLKAEQHQQKRSSRPCAWPSHPHRDGARDRTIPLGFESRRPRPPRHWIRPVDRRPRSGGRGRHLPQGLPRRRALPLWAGATHVIRRRPSCGAVRHMRLLAARERSHEGLQGDVDEGVADGVALRKRAAPPNMVSAPPTKGRRHPQKQHFGHKKTAFRPQKQRFGHKNSVSEALRVGLARWPWAFSRAFGCEKTFPRS